VGLIFGAILFELVQHAIKHYLAHHKKRGKHYSTKLWQRINEELMVLGVLALSVWIMRMTGFLAWLVDDREVDKLGPHDEDSLLHQLENTHMRLFLAMCVYFATVIILVFRAEAHLKGITWAWENWYFEFRADKPHRVEPNRYITADEEAFFKHLTLKFHAHLRRNVADGGMAWGDRELRVFNFAAYLTNSMEELLVSMVEISLNTWIGFGILAVFISLVTGLTHVDDVGVMFIMFGLNAVVLIAIFVTSIFAYLGYSNLAKNRPTWWLVNVHPYHFEKIYIQTLQVGMIFSCYTMVFFMTATISIHDMLPNHPKVAYPVIILCYYLPVLLVFFFMVPWVINRFNMVVRLPPFFDAKEKQMCKLVLRGHYHHFFFQRIKFKHLGGSSSESSVGVCSVIDEMSDGAVVPYSYTSYVDSDAPQHGVVGH